MLSKRAGSKHFSMEKYLDIMNELLRERLRNARKPTGGFGRLLMRAMNISHYQLTGWGLSHLSIGKQDSILDIGCGGGGTVHRLAKIARLGKVYGIDYSNESVMVSRMTNQHSIQMGHVDIRQGSVSCLPFSDGMFDLVTAVNTHNYWPDLVTDMQEILRVLKPGGKVIIIGTVYEGGKHDRRNQEYRKVIELVFPSVNELGGLLLRAGYSDVEMVEKHNRSWMCCIGKKPWQQR